MISSLILRSLSLCLLPDLLVGKKGTRLSKSDIRVQIVHSDHNAARGNDDEEDVKEPMVISSNNVVLNALYIQNKYI